MNTEEWSIQQIAKIAGTTSRTLRHYGDIGLLRAVEHRSQRLPPLRPAIRSCDCSGSCCCETWASGLPRSPRCSIARHPRKTP